MLCCLSCQIRFDLKRCNDKLYFFKGCWPSFFQYESIDKLSEQELQCSVCLIGVVTDAVIRGDYFENRTTNAAAESFNAKVKAFRAQFRGVRDIPFFIYRLTKLFA